MDSRFTTTTQIVKLIGSHTISKLTLRIGDLKKTKMVRTLNVYYNNKSVQGVLELKNKPGNIHINKFNDNTIQGHHMVHIEGSNIWNLV